MDFLLAFALTLIAAVLISKRAERTVLSTSVMFLAAGFLLHLLGGFTVSPENPIVIRGIEVAIFAMLFTDGLRLQPRNFGEWKLPGRALLIGMPLTIAIIALLAHYLVDLPWTQAFLVGAALSPTDPVLAQAIIGRQEVPERLRRMLNVESGLNDGLAAPFVLLLLAAVSHRAGDPSEIVIQMLYGIGIGFAVPWAAVRLQRFSAFGASSRYQPLGPFAIGLLLLALALITQANIFLTAFAGGMSLAFFGSPEHYEEFHRFGELISELLKLAALMLFGALLTVRTFEDVPWQAYVLVALVLLLARPAALAVALFRAGLSKEEWITAAWFGPKGFASVIYGLFILQAASQDALFEARIIGLTAVFSIVLHSSTDVPIAQWFARQAERQNENTPEPSQRTAS